MCSAPRHATSRFAIDESHSHRPCPEITTPRSRPRWRSPTGWRTPWPRRPPAPAGRQHLAPPPGDPPGPARGPSGRAVHPPPWRRHRDRRVPGGRRDHRGGWRLARPAPLQVRPAGPHGDVRCLSGRQTPGHRLNALAPAGSKPLCVKGRLRARRSGAVGAGVAWCSGPGVASSEVPVFRVQPATLD